MLNRGRDALALGFLWLLVLIFFWRLVTPNLADRQYYVTGDFTWKQQAQDTVIAQSWAAGRVPLWNPYIYAGQPLAADSGAAVFYPMSILFDATAGAAGVSILRMEWRVILDFLLAATLAYAFFRNLSRSYTAALVGTVVFTFGGYLTSYPPHQLDILETGTWLPPALLATRHVFADQGLSRRQRVRWALLGGLALALAFLAGHPQTCLLVVDAVVAYALYLGIRYQTLWRVWAEAGAAALVALGLSAIQLIPSLELFPLSNRTAIPAAAARAGIAAQALPNLVLPHYADQAALWVGAGGVVLALAGAWLARKQESWFWLGLAVVALLLSMGGQTPLYDVMQHLGFGLIRDQSRTIFLTSFAVATMATLGMAEILARPARQPLLLLAGVASLGGAAATPLLHRAGNPLASGGADAPLWLRGVPLLVVLAGLAMVSTKMSPTRGRVDVGGANGQRAATSLHRIGSALPGLALALLLALDGMAVNWNNNLTPTPPALGDGLPGTIAFLHTLPGAFRVATDGNQIIPANDFGDYRLATDQGYNDFRLAAIDNLLTSTNYWRTWQLLNVHEFLSTRTLGNPYALQYTEHGIHTYAVSYMLPAAWVVWQYQVVPKASAGLGAVLAPSFDPGQQVILGRAPATPIPSLPQHAQQVMERDIAPEQSVITATVDHPAILVRSVAYYPGWTVTVDGQPATVLRADHALQAVVIPAGRHTVVFTLDPWSVKIGAVLTLLTALATAAGAVLLGRKRKPPVAGYRQHAAAKGAAAGPPKVPVSSGTSAP